MIAFTSLTLIFSVGIIVAAVQDWSDGRYTKAGCNLKFILDWAWARVVEIKVNRRSSYELNMNMNEY